MLNHNGYIKSKLDYSLFTKSVGGKMVYLLVYVDNKLITRPDTRLTDELKGFLKSNFKFKYLGFLRYFIGLEIA